jgi:bifunctional DNase/RNase
MNNKIQVSVNSIRLEENSDTPIMLLSDPLSNKVLPIWIGTIEAVSIAYAQEGVLHERPQTHDLIIDVIESLNAVLKEVSITNIKDKSYYADLILTTINGDISLTARPSDAVALALRSEAPITVNRDVFEANSIDLISDKSDDIKEFKEFIDKIIPDDFL